MVYSKSWFSSFQTTCQSILVPSISCLRVYMGCAWALIFQVRSLLHGPLSRVHFGESLVVRLYSEIDQIHHSSEAQCVSHHLPPVDCHSLCTFKNNLCFSGMSEGKTNTCITETSIYFIVRHIFYTLTTLPIKQYTEDGL